MFAKRLRWLAPASLTLLLFELLAGSGAAQAATKHDAIQGTGSSWSANAVNQWVADVQSSGLRVVYTPPGSAQGRKDFAAYNTDFGVSDIGYQGTDPKSGADDTSPRPYAYLPIVAGGTAFPYQLLVGGKKVTNLRLSGLTLAKIFTNHITNWNDPAISSDNNGRKFPSKPIIPVVHSEGAGSTAQFTRYLATMFPALWTPFNNSPAMTEYFPAQGSQVAQSGSDGAMNYIASKSGDGTIGYDEYSYALGAGFPVAKIENAAGYYTLPTDKNDAVALTQAQINMDPTSKDYLLQNLDKVYTYSDPRTYPLSSYSYAIIPTSASDRRMTTGKRQTLADFLFYSICGGQAEMGAIGYSPLPLNLVKASFAQVTKLHGADAGVDVSNQKPENCNNPTFDKANPRKNLLAETAPLPAACDKQGAGPCGTTVVILVQPSGSATGTGSSTPTSTANSSSAGTTTGATGPANPTASASTRIDPVTGQLVTVGSGNGQSSDGSATGVGAEAVPTDLAAYQRTTSNTVPAVLAVALLILVLVLPPVLVRRFGQRKQNP